MGFIARDLTFANMAGPLNHLVVALQFDSNLSVCLLPLRLRDLSSIADLGDVVCAVAPPVLP
jgi:hypothetical protein